jgi:hypothetical protein
MDPSMSVYQSHLSDAPKNEATPGLPQGGEANPGVAPRSFLPLALPPLLVRNFLHPPPPDIVLARSETPGLLSSQITSSRPWQHRNIPRGACPRTELGHLQGLHPLGTLLVIAPPPTLAPNRALTHRPFPIMLDPCGLAACVFSSRGSAPRGQWFIPTWAFRINSFALPGIWHLSTSIIMGQITSRIDLHGFGHQLSKPPLVLAPPWESSRVFPPSWLQTRVEPPGPYRLSLSIEFLLTCP